jgi:primosomal replication protein N
MHSKGPAVVWGRATEERYSEITSGTSLWQQGLIATCKGSSNEAKAEGEESQVGWTHGSVRAMTEE